MSIQLPLILFKGDEEVLRLSCSGGWAALNKDSGIISNALWVAEMGREFYEKRNDAPWPAFDRMEVKVGERTITVNRYTGLDPFYSLERAGVPTEHLLSQARDHREALQALPETPEIAEAIMATSHFIERLQRKIGA